MKKILLCLMILVASNSSFSQQIDMSKIDMSKMNTRKYYSKKSTNQLIVGTILLGIGGTTIALVNSGTVSFDSPGLVLLGALCIPVSIPFLISSWLNTRKALHATTYLKMEKVPILQQTVKNFHTYPAISLKINL